MQTLEITIGEIINNTYSITSSQLPKQTAEIEKSNYIRELMSAQKMEYVFAEYNESSDSFHIVADMYKINYLKDFANNYYPLMIADMAVFYDKIPKNYRFRAGVMDNLMKQNFLSTRVTFCIQKMVLAFSWSGFKYYTKFD